MVFNVFLYFIFDLILRCFENLKIDLTVRCLENSPNKCYKQINTEDAINLELMMIIYLFYVLQWLQCIVLIILHFTLSLS